MLKLLLDPSDEDRAFVPFKKQDEVVLLCNNQGGMSSLEMGALVDETLAQLGEPTHTHWIIRTERSLRSH